MPTAYESWSREDLIARIVALEDPPLAKRLSPKQKKKQMLPQKPFDFSSHPQRKIALKFCYSGYDYNGLAIQSEPTPLPTVEGVLWDALCEARLVDREQGMEGCDWSRCGRTDRGVSAAGQVVALWVRSAIREIPLAAETAPTEEPRPSLVNKELRYIHVLNRILPPTIRILAWSPVSDSFSARFNCRFRHYKYFFTCDSPPLSIPLMQDAASRLIGEYDFRNFCKLDGSKQIENYHRRIISATITPVDGEVYVLDLIGTAFLWHQVRHVMGILFLVGQQLEPPSIVDALLNVDPLNSHPDPNVPVLETKPVYDMADDLPLVLWDCGYAEEDVHWTTDSNHDDEDGGQGSKGSTRLYDFMQTIQTRSLIRATLDKQFLLAASVFHSLPPSPTIQPPPGSFRTGSMTRIRVGGGKLKHQSKYTPLLLRERGDSADAVNSKWMAGRGMKRASKREQALSIHDLDSTVGEGKDQNPEH